MDDYKAATQLASGETSRFVSELRALDADDWAKPTCCTGWDVRAEVSHLVWVARFLPTTVERGLRGDTSGGLTPEERQRGMGELSAMSVVDLTQALETRTEHTNQLLGGLTPHQSEQLAWHPNGLRSAAWFALQWLQEVACHRWDVLEATRTGGQTAEFDAQCAELLLPMITESNLPAAYRRFGPKDTQASYVVGVSGDPARQWTLRARDGDAIAERGIGEVQAHIQGPPGWLLLALWGRLPIAQLRAAGHLTIDGDVAAAERFKDIFKGP